jgi:hypothetical protein
MPKQPPTLPTIVINVEKAHQAIAALQAAAKHKKALTKKSPAKKGPPKKQPGKNAPATKKTIVKKVSAKKGPVKKAPPKKTIAKKAPAKNFPGRGFERSSLDIYYAQKANVIMEWIAHHPVFGTKEYEDQIPDIVDDIMACNSIPWSPSCPDWPSMVEDGLVDPIHQSGAEKIMRNIVLPDELRKKLESLEAQPTRRSSRVQDSKVQKDQADKVSVLCDWCNDDDNEWFYGINEMHQMDLFTENGIHLAYEILKDFNHHRSARDFLGFYTTQPSSLIGYVPRQLSQEKRAEILSSCYLLKKPRWARIDDGESPVSDGESPVSESD